MEMRMFGRTGLELSVLGFGCGAVGGLMVRGDPVDQERTIARAITAGVNYGYLCHGNLPSSAMSRRLIFSHCF
jgi:predicted aldo/keto reductase-like oxidoreductase